LSSKKIFVSDFKGKVHGAMKEGAMSGGTLKVAFLPTNRTAVLNQR
jgi:hypothetical protein